MAHHERLSAQDAYFLYAESPVAHMHVGSLAVFEDSGFTEEQLDRHVESRLHLVPRFRQRLAWVPGGQGRPVWVDDAHFDIRFHVRFTGLPRPAGIREAARLMGRVMSQPLDRDRPLWEMWVFDLPDNRKGIIQKTHHCLNDGVTGVDLGTVVLDLSPAPSPMDPPPPWAPEAAPSGARLLGEALVERLTQPRELARSMRAALRPQREMVSRGLEIASGLVAFGRSHLGERPPPTSLTAEIGPHRRFEHTQLDLAELKRLKQHFHCTVNDIVLALVTGALRRLFLSRGEAVGGLVLKAMVPVSVADPSRQSTYGNVVSMMRAELPVGEVSPERRVEFIRQRMAGLRNSGQAVAADFWVKLSEYASPTILSMAGRASARHRMANLVITNVPGPQFPLYLCGGRMLEVYPFVPLRGLTSLGIAIQSYNGRVFFGLVGDWDVVPDLVVVTEGIERSFQELREYVDTHPRSEERRRSLAS